MTEAMQTAICIGFDAMRIALGVEPKNYSVDQVIMWLTLMRAQKC